jgi:hypothetical protein
MNNFPFNKEVEFKDVGKWPSIPNVYGIPMTEVRKFNTPITPKENFQRMMSKEKPLWIPTFLHDFNFIQPLAMPDAHARVFGGTDWFGIQWEYEKLTNAAMVKPGTRRLSDITQWEKELVWPDLSAIDWAKDYEEHYKPVISPDRPTMIAIVNGFFERLADLTSFEDTLCYFIEEPEAVESLYARLCDWHIELFAIAKKYYHADVITFHDDMGTQRSSFFSPDMFREVMLPHYKCMNDAAHEMGLVVNFHSCGSVANQIENFCDAGFDIWEGQDACNDKKAIMNEYGDRIGQIAFIIAPPDMNDEDLKKDIRNRIVNLGKFGNYCVLLRDPAPNRSFKAEEYLYEMSRRYYAGEQI